MYTWLAPDWNVSQGPSGNLNAVNANLRERESNPRSSRVSQDLRRWGFCSLQSLDACKHSFELFPFYTFAFFFTVASDFGLGFDNFCSLCLPIAGILRKSRFGMIERSLDRVFNMYIWVIVTKLGCFGCIFRPNPKDEIFISIIRHSFRGFM